MWFIAYDDRSWFRLPEWEENLMEELWGQELTSFSYSEMTQDETEYDVKPRCWYAASNCHKTEYKINLDEMTQENTTTRRKRRLFRVASNK